MSRKTNLSVVRQIQYFLLIFILVVAFFWIVIQINNHFSVSKPWQKIPLPNIIGDDIHLNVAHVINHRFDALTEQQVKQVLLRTTVLMREHFDVEVSLDFKHTLAINELFSLLPEQVVEDRQASIIDPLNIDQTQLFRLSNVLFDSMQSSASTQTLIDFAQPYLIDQPQVNNLAELSRALIDTMITRMRYWYDYPAADGLPVINDQPYNQWVWWDSLGYGEMPFEVVITNQLVASMENYDVAIHSSLRGGINGGTMTYSRNSPYKAYVFVSTYQLLNNNPMLAELKDNDVYNEQQIIDYAAATLAHELGHLVFHYGHPFGVSGCIMAPTPLLKYRQWYEALDADACHRANHPKMQHGAEDIIYNPNW